MSAGVEGAKRQPVWQFVPEDYFREQTVEEIFPGRGELPVEVDLGCGDGSFVTELAAAEPERNFLGVERLMGRVRKVSRKAERRGLQNVRVLRLDSAYTLEWLLPRAEVARVHLLCPDPWPKKRHQKRRLVDAAFVGGLERVLIRGGEFLFKSDHSEYYDEVVDTLRGSRLLREERWDEGAFYYPQTDFERVWIAEGRTIRRARFVKVEQGD